MEDQKDADELKKDTEEGKREADELKKDADEFKNESKKNAEEGERDLDDAQKDADEAEKDADESVGFTCFWKMFLHRYRLFCIVYVGAENGDICVVYLPPLAQHYKYELIFTHSAKKSSWQPNVMT